VSVDGRVRLEELICDGLLLATPAGSTAYNLSAHGPILPLEAPLLALTPVSAFRPRRWRGALLPNKVTVDDRGAGGGEAAGQCGGRQYRGEIGDLGADRRIGRPFRASSCPIRITRGPTGFLPNSSITETVDPSFGTGVLPCTRHVLAAALALVFHRRLRRPGPKASRRSSETVTFVVSTGFWEEPVDDAATEERRDRQAGDGRGGASRPRCAGVITSLIAVRQPDGTARGPPPADRGHRQPARRSPRRPCSKSFPR
jgi:hypothetical protein